MAPQEKLATRTATSNGEPDTTAKATKKPTVDDDIDENKNETKAAQRNGDVANDQKTSLQRNVSIRSRKYRVLADLILVCAGFLLHLAAYNGTVSLQSSINGQLGIEVLTAMSVSGIASNLLLTTLVIDKLGIKWTLLAAAILKSTFPLANLHSTWWSLYTASTISGLLMGPMLASLSAYISWLGRRYAEMTGESADTINSRFFGVFFTFQRSAHLAGNFMTSLVFRRPSSTGNSNNGTALIFLDDLVSKVCASNYCNQNLDQIFASPSNGTVDGGGGGTSTSTSFYRPSEHQKHLLFGIYLALSVAAPLLFLFTTTKDKTVSSSSEDEQKSGSKLYHQVSATFTHMAHWKAILLVPMSVYMGVSFAFFITTFNLAFVTCGLGIDSLGYVATAASGSGALFAMACGALVKYTGARVVMLFATTVMLTTNVAMLNWSFSTESSVILYVMAAAFGASNAIIQTELTAFIASVYRTPKSESSAYAAHNLWTMVGMTMWHSASVHVCVGTQIYAVIGILVVGVLGLMVVDVATDHENKRLAARIDDLQHMDTRL